MNRAATAFFQIVTLLWGSIIYGQESSDVRASLLLESDWDFLGPDGVLFALPFILKEELRVDDVYVDEIALARHGVQLMKMPLGMVRTSGVSRRSALRFLLSKNGLGYWISSPKLLVLSTKVIADRKWSESVAPPSVEAISQGPLEARRDAVFMSAFHVIDGNQRFDALVECLQDADLDLRFNAAFAIAQYGAAGGRAAPNLGVTLHSDNLTIREACAYALGSIGESGANELVRLLSDPDASIARKAAEGLAFHGSPGHALIPEVVAAALKRVDGVELDDERDSFLAALATAVVSLDSGKVEAIIAPLLESKEPAPRVFALAVIQRLGRRSELDVESYVQLLSDENVFVRRGAGFALHQVPLDELKSVDVLIRATDDPDYETRKWAALTLSGIKVKSPHLLQQKQ